ncbi:hypothetical protein BDK51DRAFT_26121 [Blyttiomyces helicus]|uniref:Uncharacterized protein n=1 Tax=Blyttiomyces helicus TaxID=388810 RepID=A0A4P9WB75_9FUNG|nr:hypothetical protein BDK51DRAFT_26121 [Blyttiomyces helicus]|eukprot:RKO88793.1 hypothetical protein BDK51DRAFT_26121 [Blyttiomyces helicus]
MLRRTTTAICLPEGVRFLQTFSFLDAFLDYGRRKTSLTAVTTTAAQFPYQNVQQPHLPRAHGYLHTWMRILEGDLALLAKGLQSCKQFAKFKSSSHGVARMCHACMVTDAHAEPILHLANQHTQDALCSCCDQRNDKVRTKNARDFLKVYGVVATAAEIGLSSNLPVSDRSGPPPYELLLITTQHCESGDINQHWMALVEKLCWLECIAGEAAGLNKPSGFHRTNLPHLLFKEPPPTPGNGNFEPLEILIPATRQLQCDIYNQHKHNPTFDEHYVTHFPGFLRGYMTFGNEKLLGLLGLRVARSCYNTAMLTHPRVGVPKKFAVTSSDVVYEYRVVRFGFFLCVTFHKGDWNLFQIQSLAVNGNADLWSFSASWLSGYNYRSEDSWFLSECKGQVEDEEEVLILGLIHISAIEVLKRRPIVHWAA